jgi:hypothetical protein
LPKPHEIFEFQVGSYASVIPLRIRSGGPAFMQRARLGGVQYDTWSTLLDGAYIQILTFFTPRHSTVPSKVPLIGPKIIPT